MNTHLSTRPMRYMLVNIAGPLLRPSSDRPAFRIVASWLSQFQQLDELLGRWIKLGSKSSKSNNTVDLDYHVLKMDHYALWYSSLNRQVVHGHPADVFSKQEVLSYFQSKARRRDVTESAGKKEQGETETGGTDHNM